MKSITNLEHFKGYEELVHRIEDLVNQYERYQKARLTPFLRPNEIEIVKKVLGNQVDYSFDGGFKNAETKRCIIGNGDSEIVCLKAKIANKNLHLEHRDVLGAIMNCGLKREQFGDIFLLEDEAFVYCTNESSQYVKENVTQIGKMKVEFFETEKVENIAHIKEFNQSVSSYRIDSIVSCLCHISRSKAVDYIKRDLVSLNYEICSEINHLCKDNDIISIRGHGRYILYETINQTKKNRLWIRYGKYE